MNLDSTSQREVPVVMTAMSAQWRFVMTVMGLVAAQCCVTFTFFVLGTQGWFDATTAILSFVILTVLALLYLYMRQQRSDAVTGILASSVLWLSLAALVGNLVRFKLVAVALPSLTMGFVLLLTGVLSTWLAAVLLLQHSFPLRLALPCTLTLACFATTIWMFDASATFLAIEAAWLMLWSTFTLSRVEASMETTASDKAWSAASQQTLALLLTVPAFGRFVLGRSDN